MKLVIVESPAKAKTIDVVLPYLEKISRRVLEAQELEALEHHRQYQRRSASAAGF